MLLSQPYYLKWLPENLGTSEPLNPNILHNDPKKSFVVGKFILQTTNKDCHLAGGWHSTEVAFTPSPPGFDSWHSQDIFKFEIS